MLQATSDWRRSSSQCQVHVALVERVLVRRVRIACGASDACFVVPYVRQPPRRVACLLQREDDGTDHDDDAVELMLMPL